MTKDRIALLVVAAVAVGGVAFQAIGSEGSSVANRDFSVVARGVADVQEANKFAGIWIVSPGKIVYCEVLVSNTTGGVVGPDPSTPKCGPPINRPQ